jgi:hypothetical protein
MAATNRYSVAAIFDNLRSANTNEYCKLFFKINSVNSTDFFISDCM